MVNIVPQPGADPMWIMTELGCVDIVRTIRCGNTAPGPHCVRLDPYIGSGRTILRDTQST